MDFKQQIKDKGLKISFVAEKIEVPTPNLSRYLSGTRKMPEDIKERLTGFLISK